MIDSPYELETKTEVFIESFIVIMNGVIFSIIINSVGNII